MSDAPQDITERAAALLANVTPDDNGAIVPQTTPAISGEIVRRYSFADDERFNGYGDEYIHTELFGFCGCGNPDQSLQHILTVLRGIKARGAGSFENFEADERQRETAAGNANAYVFTLYWLDKEGYTEHGGSVYSCWLSPKGETLLDDLELLFSDDDESEEADE